MCGDIV